MNLNCRPNRVSVKEAMITLMLFMLLTNIVILFNNVRHFSVSVQKRTYTITGPWQMTADHACDG